MSADRWSVCPACYLKFDPDKMQKELDALYGVISKEKFLEKQREIDHIKKNGLEETFAEYYEMGILEENTPMKFFANYHGTCSKCDYAYEYSYEDTGLEDNASNGQ